MAKSADSFLDSADAFLDQPSSQPRASADDFLDSADAFLDGEGSPDATTPVLRRVGDVGISALKGAISVPEAAVGLADIVTAGRAGKIAEEAGFRPREAKATLNELLSPAQKAANKAVGDAKGFVPTIEAAVRNPSTIGHAVVESLPSMGAGGVFARALPLAPWVAGAIGEGVVSGGLAAEQTRQETKDGMLAPKQAAAAVASGIGTAAFSMAGARVAKKLGIADVDTLLAGGGRQVTQKGIARRIVEGGISEGVFEELPQTAQERIWQNAALDRPLLEGVPEESAMGLLTGTAMGGGANAATGRAGAAPEGQDAGQVNSPVSADEFLGGTSDVEEVLSGDARGPAKAAAGTENLPVQQEQPAAPIVEPAQQAAPVQPSASVAPQTTTAVDLAAHEAATSPLNNIKEPTEAQKEAGSYKKGNIKVGGLDIAIENPEGSKRRPEWPELKSHYGYFKRTEGKDGDQVDVFVKPGTPEDYSGPVFVVDQVDTKTGAFDEHKALLGYQDAESAKSGYLENYTPGWAGLGAIKQLTLPEFRLWLKNGNTKRPMALKGKKLIANPKLEERTAPPAQETPASANRDIEYVNRRIKFLEARKTHTQSTANELRMLREERDRIADKPAAASPEPAPAKPEVTPTPAAPAAASAPPAPAQTPVASESKPADLAGEVDQKNRQKDQGQDVTGQSKDATGQGADVTGRGDVDSRQPSVNSDLADQITEAAKAMTKAAEALTTAVEANKTEKPAAAANEETDTDVSESGKAIDAAAQEAPTAAPVAESKIDDVGEKVGGARKDTAESTGPRGTREKDTTPGWRKRYEIAQVEKSMRPEEEGRWYIYDKRREDWRGQNDQVGDRKGYATKEEADTAVPLVAVARNHRVVPIRPERTLAEIEAEIAKDSATVKANTGTAESIAHGVMQKAGAELRRGNISQEKFDELKAKYGEAADKYQPTRTAEDSDTKWEIWRDITDRKRVKVLDRQFDSREDAMRYMAQHAAEIIETKTSFGEEILPVPDKVTREGEARRTGNVTGEDFRETYGFRAVEFGLWNNQEERQQVMNHAYDALADLAEILNIPAKSIGLNGDLALAFGARGQGLSGARAHYEGDYGVINLTKMSGAGSLAHEWLHAADHYFGRQDTKAKSEKVLNKRGDKVYPDQDVSAAFASYGFKKEGSGVRPEVRDAYKAVIDTMMTKAEQYVEDTQKADRFVAQVRDDVAKALAAIRKDLAEQKDVRYWKRNNKPAGAEQLAEFDTVAEKLIAGEFLETEWKHGDSKNRRSMLSGRWTNDALEKLSAIYKTVRGRSGFMSSPQRGVLDNLRDDMKHYSVRLKMLADAQSGGTKTKKVPTSFAMEARSIDQGRASEYWTTPHEMAARAFQAYVEDKVAEKGGRSDFLTYGTNKVVPTPWGWKRPFPTGEERKAINAAFDKLVGELKTKETDQGVALFSRTGDTGDTGETGASFSRNAKQPTFYSQLARAIGSAKQAAMPAKQWALWLKANAAKLGVKQDEIDAVGINEFLDLQTGQVTRESVLDFVNKNGVQIKEVTLGGESSNQYEAYVLKMEAKYGEGYDTDALTESERTEQTRLWNKSQERGGTADLLTKFQSYQLPGGENYRELLLTLPAKPVAPQKLEWKKNASGKWAWFDNDKQVSGAYQDESDAEYAKTVHANLPQKDTTNFRSGHFDEPNILSHVRFNERIDSENKRVLFIEELQSDYGATMRKSLAAIKLAVDNDFNGIVSRMKDAGVLEINCD